MTPIRATALHLEAVKAEPWDRFVAPLGDALDRMVSIQAGQYPDHWSDADRRELAEKHLFGEGK